MTPLKIEHIEYGKKIQVWSNNLIKNHKQVWFVRTSYGFGLNNLNHIRFSMLAIAKNHSRFRVRVRACTSCKSLGQSGFYSLIWAHKVHFLGVEFSPIQKKKKLDTLHLFISFKFDDFQCARFSLYNKKNSVNDVN